MRTEEKKKLGLAGALFALAATIIALRSGKDTVPQSWFYDESAEVLFAGPLNAIPPITGIDGPEEDGVRAVVVAPAGQCGKEDARESAYLEKFSPLLKRQMEATERAKATGEVVPELLDRSSATAHRFVRRLGDAEWASLRTQLGLEIVETWRQNSPSLEACQP